MIPLDRYEKWTSRLDVEASRYLSQQEHQAFLAIPPAERLRQLEALLHKPLAQFSPVNEVFFRARWGEVLRLAGLDQRPTLLEVASGATDMIPQMMARDVPHSQYISANMNKILTRRLQEKTRGLPLDIRVIEEDAAGIEDYLAAESVDLIAFQHAVNDVWQAILCDREGVDTIHTDWMETLPRMIAILQRELEEGTFEAHVRPGWTALLAHLARVLKKGGLMVMNHYMFQLDLDWGYPPGLWESIIPTARAWLDGLDGFQERSFDGFDPQWWLFLQKC